MTCFRCANTATTIPPIIILLCIIITLSFPIVSGNYQQQQQQNIDEQLLLCVNGYWPFSSSPCSGYGACVNGSCLCNYQINEQNDFVPTNIILRVNNSIIGIKTGCQTENLSRKIIAGILSVASFGGVSMAVYKVYCAFPFPLDSLNIASPKTACIICIVQFLASMIFGIYALAGYWTINYTPMAIAFIIHSVTTTIGGPSISLSIIQVNYTIISGNNNYNLKFKTVKMIYFFSSLLYSLITISIVLAANLTESIDLKLITARIVPGLYTGLLFFWGCFGGFQVVLIDNKALKHASNRARANAFRQTCYVNCGACIFTAFIGLLGTIIPHWYGHIHMSIHIFAVLSNVNWMRSLRFDKREKSEVIIDTNSSDKKVSSKSSKLSKESKGESE